jgi:putative transposase
VPVAGVISVATTRPLQFSITTCPMCHNLAADPGGHWQVNRASGAYSERSSYPRHRFPAEIISHAVWLYHVFSLSLRDVELILAERGVVVTHESIRHWCLKFGADFARRLRRLRPQPGDTWHLDEVFIRIRGELHFVARSRPRRRAGHLGARLWERRGRKVFLQTPVAWVEIQTATPHH